MQYWTKVDSMDGKYVEIPIKIIYQDRRDETFRREQEATVPVFISQEDWAIIQQEADKGLRTIEQSQLTEHLQMEGTRTPESEHRSFRGQQLGEALDGWIARGRNY